MSHSDSNQSLVVTCDCEEATCTAWLELTPEGTLAIEDADGMRLSLLLPDWLESAIRTAISARVSSTSVKGMPSIRKTAWPEPTTEEPDLETLETWMHEDGGCEATDSCWVEPDGICEHGHPSWLLALNLI